MFFRKREKAFLEAIRALLELLSARLPRDCEMAELRRQNKALRTHKFNSRRAMRDMQKAYMRVKLERDLLKSGVGIAVGFVKEMENSVAKLQQSGAPGAQELDATKASPIRVDTAGRKESVQTLS